MKDWKNFFKKVFFTAMKTLILQTWKQIEFFPYLQCHMQKKTLCISSCTIFMPQFVFD